MSPSPLTPPSPSRSGPRPGSVSRRAVLAAGTGALLAGCALNNPLSEEKTPAAEAVRELAPDVAIAVEAASRLETAAAAVKATREAHPALAAPLDGLARLHEAHLNAVREAVPDGVDLTPPTPPAPVPPRPAAAVTAVRTAERALHGQLTALALRAQSGPFARLLGSMAAGVSQQLAAPGLAVRR